MNQGGDEKSKSIVDTATSTATTTDSRMVAGSLPTFLLSVIQARNANSDAVVECIPGTTTTKAMKDAPPKIMGEVFDCTKRVPTRSVNEDDTAQIKIRKLDGLDRQVQLGVTSDFNGSSRDDFLMEIVRDRAAETISPAPAAAHSEPVAATDSSQPGAYAAAPGVRPNRRGPDLSSLSAESAIWGTTSSDPSTRSFRIQSTWSPSEVFGLTRAHPVQEESQFLHMEAQPMDMEESEKRKQQVKRNECKLMVAFFFIVLSVISAAFAVGFMVGERRGQAQCRTITVTTPAPSMSPTTTGEAIWDGLMTLLPEFTRTTILNQTSSPQARAFYWLLNDPRILDYPDWRVLQRFALAVLHFSTDGPNWTKSSRWMTFDTHECSWYGRPTFAMKDILSSIYPGILDEFQDNPPPPRCNDQGVYQHLWLDQNELKGTIPEELFLVTTLKTLSLGKNYLTGSMPTTIGYMTNLEGLGNFLMGMSGEIPSEIGLLTNMRMFGMNDNGFQGKIPIEFWQMTKLQSLVMNAIVDLSGTIPTEVGLLSQLRWFTFDKTPLQGTIPTEICQIKSLEWLILANGGKLQGTIPTEVGQLANVLLFSVSGNELTGTLPTELGLMTSSTMMLTARNQFYGKLPSEIGRLTNLAISLEVHANSLTGSLPTELGLLSNIYRLNLARQNFTGPIPSELGQLLSLGGLDLSSNSLTGTIPQELSLIAPRMFGFEVQGNDRLSGTMPEGVCTININTPCIPQALFPCEGEDNGLVFTCSDLLCGCGTCPCHQENINNDTRGTRLTIIPYN